MITSTKIDDTPNIKYEKRLVLFIDILGFSNLVLGSASDHEKLLKIRDSLKVLERELKREKELQELLEKNQQTLRNSPHTAYWKNDKPYVNPGKIDYTQFSDSIIISKPYINAQSLISLISNVSLLQARFLQEGILFRGGLAYGDMYHKENLCFGPAFNRAYYLESKVAKYPRIVIDNDIISGQAQPTDWTKHEKFEFEALFQSSIDTSNPFSFKDTDSEGNDLYYVNFMLLNTFRSAKTKILEIFNGQKQGLDRLDKDEEKVYLKLDWLTSTIEKHMKAFEIADAKNKEFMRQIARKQGF
ncbi:hypothetical protein [Lysinibacillus varians]|uniref:Guanylate cyclase domain-containing protein n=1 Tax=Lysinibacillus varians TaxID=1145276 RepID=A0ABY2TBX6_9BACI|nr:hypothetical protein [Lysinibacillus varians]AHN23925.1 hypothetical protein T479_01750 [Lysinibacillus varians]TKI63003.1 hypothetical protein FC752_11905 [Lysinibacillus varians]